MKKIVAIIIAFLILFPLLSDVDPSDYDATLASAHRSSSCSTLYDGWTGPVEGIATSSYGPRIDPIYKTQSFHHGTDIAAPANTPIYAANKGTVVKVGHGWSGGAGNHVIIDHGEGLFTAYFHQIDSGIVVKEGQEVSAGEEIGHVGTTGHSTGNHLHFEVRENTTLATYWQSPSTDPIEYMKERGVELGKLGGSETKPIINTSCSSGSAQGAEIVEYAKQFLGTPYVSGGTTPDGWDCSGFTSYVFNHFGYKIPRNSDDQYDAYKDKQVPYEQAQPGDLVHWSGHVAIYIGDGKVYGAQMSKGTTLELPVEYAGNGTPTFHRIVNVEGDPNADANTPDGAKAYAKSLLAKYKWDNDKEYECLVDLWTRESSWRYNATNPYSGAYGIPQSLPADKMASAGSDYKTNGQTQIRWGLEYIQGRYGSPCKAIDFHNVNHWY